MPTTATLFRPLIRQSATLYYVYDVTERRLRYVSPAFERIFPWKQEQANGMLPTLPYLVHPDDWEYLLSNLPATTDDQLVEGVEIRVRYPDGRRQWLCLSICPTTDEAGQPLLCGTIHDTTRTREYIENADLFNAKKNSTLEILSHDLAGPLLSARRLADTVADYARTYQNDHLNELVRLIRVTCEDSVQLIREFVDQEFMTSASIQLNRTRFDLIDRLRAVFDTYQKSQDSIQKRFELVSPVPVLYVDYDEMKFMQAINNLLSNAIKFTPDGGLIQIIVEPRGPSRLRLTVADNGIGIPLALQPILFDKFTRARRPGLRGENTTGLGMSIIKTIVELHQGRISVDSAENQGTRFHLDLPVFPEGANAFPLLDEAPSTGANSGHQSHS